MLKLRLTFRSFYFLFALFVLVLALGFWYIKLYLPNSFSKQFEPLLQKTYESLNRFSDADLDYMAGRINADAYRKSWNTLGNEIEAVRNKEAQLLKSPQYRTFKRLNLHYEGLGYIYEATRIVKGFMEDEEQQADPLGSARRILINGLNLIKEAEKGWQPQPYSSQT